MNAPSQFTSQAEEDLDAIWWFIAQDNRDAADRAEWDLETVELAPKAVIWST